MSETIDETKLIEAIKSKKERLAELSILISELNVKSDEVISQAIQEQPA